MSFYQLSAKTIKGVPFPFEALKGKTVVIVNVASFCGYTPQYAGLEAMHQKYKDRGLVVLGFPSNDFHQEYKDNEKVEEFCTSKFNVTFQMMETVKVNGDDAHPVYKWLTAQTSKPGYLWGSTNKVKWNFEKYIVNKNGEFAGWGGSKETPAEIEKKVEAML